ncbi:MAG: DNA topoisomerase III [Proteobacteria bacterium]|nr:MAG: DNA topoisomerase III [Pseudomonadota bacterium]PIE64953.1 MAG: DNA topoisomerase III [Desulfobacterales bacterium]
MSKKTLIIAEKPSVAADLVKVLPGSFKKSRTHYENADYIVSYAIGHLVSICYPEEIDPSYQKWNINNLPILPETFPLKGLDGTKTQLNSLQKLIRRKDVTTIINACDAGREGELIFKYILQFVWNKSVATKKIKRLWLQSMTDEAIQSGLAHLRENTEMLALEDTALCRSESDWLIGINATRALTAYNSRFGGFFLTPCGRVQTPTLSMLVKREQERLTFIPRPYRIVIGTFSHENDSYFGKWIDQDFKKDKNDPDKKADRLWDPGKAAAIREKCRNKPAIVEETTKETSQSSPPLYDLTSLQREANAQFGFSARNTLALAQALYERHKVLTYPRTDSRYLPEDYLKTVGSLMNRQKNGPFGHFAATVLAKKYIRKDKRIFNNGKVTDHHAIIPTNRLPDELSEPEMKIYRMIVQRFLAVFFPPARFLNTKRISTVEQEVFLTEGKILKEPGWKAIYLKNRPEKGAGILTPVPAGAKVLCTALDEEQKETKPPPRFSEATLLSAMENSGKLLDDEELAEAMRERGLGTPATRAAIIEKLLKEKYLVREGRELTPTGKAFDLLSLLDAMEIDVLASPELTGEWEYKLNQILKGNLTRDQFMQEIRDLTVQVTERIKNFDDREHRKEASFSPIGPHRFFETATSYCREDDAVIIRKILGGRIMQTAEIVELINGKTIGPFSDFRSKKGKSFTASIRLKKNRIDFLFADSTTELDIDAIKQSTPLGRSPIDGTSVFQTETGYMSESALDNDQKKGLKISKIILSKEITPDHIHQLLTDGKTELIKGFISKRKKPFDAYLLLEKNGKISFEFPPRTNRKNKKNS